MSQISFSKTFCGFLASYNATTEDHSKYKKRMKNTTLKKLWVDIYVLCGQVYVVLDSRKQQKVFENDIWDN